MEDASQKATQIIMRAKENGATLRLIGGLAVKKFCKELEFCEREHGDIDLVGLSHESQLIIKTLTSLGYKEKKEYTLASSGHRLLFELLDSHDHVDIFLDKLWMEHDIDLRKRLHIDDITIPVSDLIVCKLIVLDLTEKDYRDIVTLVKDLETGTEDLPSIINLNYISKLCSESWGLYHDILESIDKCIAFLETYHFEEAVSQEITSKFNLMRTAIIEHPKSVRWKLRSYVGERYHWRKIVELESVK
ncbi:MAG: hypothetical protein ACFFBL_10115 [Promethearchaeota archaeon]